MQEAIAMDQAHQNADDLVFGLGKLEAVQYELRCIPQGGGVLPEMAEIAGGCFVTDFGDWVEVAAFSVNLRHRRLGLGSFLIRQVIQDYERTHTICLMVDTNYYPDAPLSPEDLAAWYRRLGFEDGSPYHEGEGWMSRTAPFFVPDSTD